MNARMTEVYVLHTCEELLLDGDGINDDALDGIGMRATLLNNKHAKPACMPSLRLITSLEKVRPGIKPCFLNQKVDVKDLERKMPLTASENVFVLIDEEGICFGVEIFHHGPEHVEAASALFEKRWKKFSLTMGEECEGAR
jgi:uncharacterized protein YuzE